jgi:hypothetical protein
LGSGGNFEPLRTAASLVKLGTVWTGGQFHDITPDDSPTRSSETRPFSSAQQMPAFSPCLFDTDTRHGMAGRTRATGTGAIPAMRMSPEDAACRQSRTVPSWIALRPISRRTVSACRRASLRRPSMERLLRFTCRRPASFGKPRSVSRG